MAINEVAWSSAWRKRSRNESPSKEDSYRATMSGRVTLDTGFPPSLGSALAPYINGRCGRKPWYTRRTGGSWLPLQLPLVGRLQTFIWNCFLTSNHGDERIHLRTSGWFAMHVYMTRAGIATQTSSQFAQERPAGEGAGSTRTCQKSTSRSRQSRLSIFVTRSVCDTPRLYGTHGIESIRALSLCVPR